MKSPAVLILTEPERCQLTGADLLMQALFQIQQLSKAGLPTSQTFCDHPTSAMKFIEAYARAYPELQLRTADLPLPEQLYSVVAEGRILPLTASIALPTPNPGEANQLYPLYILSLGAPNALMQALNQSSFTTSEVKIIDIAPVEHSTQDSNRATEGMAHDGRSSQPQASADSKEDDGLGSPDGGSGDPLKLDSIEGNLDRIHIDHKHQQEIHNGRGWEELAPAVIAPHATVVAAVTPTVTVETGAGQLSASSRLYHGSSMVPEPPAGSTAVNGTVNDGDPPSLPAVGTSSTVAEPSPLPDPKPAAPGAEAASDAYHHTIGDNSANGGCGGGTEPAEANLGAADCGKQEEAEAPIGSGMSDAQPDPEMEQGSAPPASSDSEPKTRADTAGRIEGSSFHEPGGDVIYRPNASFGIDDDVSYPVPAGTGLADLLRDVFSPFSHGETVDLEAIIGSLGAPADSSSTPVEDLFRFVEKHGGNDRDADDARLANSAEKAPLLPTYNDRFDHDDAGQERAPVTHDLDI